MELNKKRTLAEMNEFVRKTRVAEFVKKYRAVLNMPQAGFEFTEEDAKETAHWSRGWIFFPSSEQAKTWHKENKDAIDNIQIWNTCRAFLGEYGLLSEYLITLFMIYLFCNIVYSGEVFSEGAGDRFVHFVSLKGIVDEYEHVPEDADFLLNGFYDEMRAKAQKYPVALLIHPDASQRQVIEYIRKHWNDMPSTMSKKTLVRTKRKQDERDAVYNLRDKPISTIRKTLALDGIFLDDGQISAILHQEAKKRGQQ